MVSLHNSKICLRVYKRNVDDFPGLDLGSMDIPRVFFNSTAVLFSDTLDIIKRSYLSKDSLDQCRPQPPIARTALTKP